MPPLESGRVYQAWGIYDGKPVSLGVLPHEAHMVAIEADLAGASTFAITEEPPGGSDQPTSDAARDRKPRLATLPAQRPRALPPAVARRALRPGRLAARSDE